MASNGSTDDDATIPELVRAWESAPNVASSVRRPSTLPDPQTYHEAIEPQAIFELDEEQKDGSIRTIFVVPAGCKRCRRTLKQACSRARPTCVRCRNAGLTECEVIDSGYQRLPGPKFGKLPSAQKQSTSSAREQAVASPASQEPTTSGRLRPRRLTSRAISLSQTHPSNPTPSGSKRPPSPEPDSVPPRKRAQAKTTSRKGKAQCLIAPPTQEMDAECSPVNPSAQTLESTGECSTLRWTFVNRDVKSSQRRERVPSNTLIPRVWTNSLGGLLTVFPELEKSKVGFSWFQSETPILLLDTNYAQGRWINSATLNIDLLWDFSCHESELEPMDMEDPTQLRAYQPGVYSPENTRDPEADTTGSRISHLPPETESLSTCAMAPAPSPPLSTPVPSSYDTPQHVQSTCHAPHRLCDEESSSHPNAAGSNPHLLVHSTPLVPADNSSPSNSCPVPHGSFSHPTSQPEPSPRACIPLKKPPEAETLSDSQLRFIPLLIWIAHDSELVPCNLPPEYAYLCMGFFFITDFRHAVVSSSISTTGLVQGRVCWSVTLQWAPGGENPLYNCASAPSSNMSPDSTPVGSTRDLSHPWWIDPTDTSSQADSSYYPRDLRMQIFSFIPLDLLAEFHPSESFPRGWFCQSCGMINVQVFFRHQICQSTTCKSAHDRHIPPGKVDPLSSLRGPYQTSILVRPNNNIPSEVASDSTAWDDGMQSWVYNVRDGVMLCHVFTGNQEQLQRDATALLERVQGEVVLCREDPCSPFFSHSTSLTHPSDGSEVLVPNGTPNGVRVAYYTLCDLVHRYGEMDRPRFGEVRLVAWVNSGYRKGNMLRATQSPAVIYCLGVEVILKFIPKGGYRITSNSDKSDGCAELHDRAGSPPSAGPSCLPEPDNGDQTLFIPGSEVTKAPIIIRNADDVAAAAMDTGHQYCTSDSGLGRSVAFNEVTEQPGRKKHKTTKDKSKPNVPEISVTLVHGDCVVLFGDDFECQIVRTGTTILVIGVPEKTT